MFSADKPRNRLGASLEMYQTLNVELKTIVIKQTWNIQRSCVKSSGFFYCSVEFPDEESLN